MSISILGIDANGQLRIVKVDTSGVLQAVLQASDGVDIGDVDVASIAAGENFIGQVGAPADTITANFTRPSNTTAYAAGDVVSDDTSSPSVITFSDVARVNAGTALITGAMAVSSADQSTKPDLELWLFHTSPTAMEDNAAFDPTDAELRNVVAVIQFPVADWFEGDPTAGADGNIWCPGTLNPENPLVEAAAADADLYGIVVVRNAYTPVSAERFDFALQVAQN